MENQINRLWEYIFDVLFCKETNLIYEHRTSYDKNGNVSDLPTPEAISIQMPNPCGWGTGMEDCATDAGIMLDAIINRYAVTHEPSMREYAEKIFNGIKLCATVSGKRGFLARGVSPEDGKSFYFNTSRDQYTHVIYSLVKYMNSGLCNDSDKSWIKDLLVAFAELVEREATPENDYQLLRADNKTGIVCKMWNVLPHEALRMSLFYLAAWVASGDSHWLNLYKQWRDGGIEQSCKYYSASSMCILVQMQVSARFLYDYDPEPEYRAKYLEILKFASKHAVQFKIENLADMDVNFLGKAWHEWELRFEWGIVMLNGYAYLNPKDELLNAVWPLLELGDAISIQALCPDLCVAEEQIEQLGEALEKIDVKIHASRAPIRICAGYWAYRAKEINN